MTLFLSLIACRAEMPTTSNEDAGHDLDSTMATVVVEETTTDETEVIVPEETEDTGDTAEPNCAFELAASGNGRVPVSNELQFSLVPSPSDSVHDDLQEVFRFNVTSLHPECGTVTADTASFKIAASDNNGGETHWANGVRIEMVDLTVDPSAAIMTGTTDMNSGGDIYGPHVGILAIPAGDTHTFAVFMDTSGARSEDMLQLALRRYMHIQNTPESAAAVMMDDDLVGGAFIYE